MSFIFHQTYPFKYRVIAHPHGYSEKSLSQKGEKISLPADGSEPWVGRVATERQAVDGEEAGQVGVGRVY